MIEIVNKEYFILRDSTSFIMCSIRLKVLQAYSSLLQNISRLLRIPIDYREMHSRKFLK
jgi:hypothetical protein